MPRDVKATYTLHDGEKVAVRTSAAASGGELLEVDAEWAAIEAKPPAHFHPHQDERFEVSEGELSVEMDGEVHAVRAGEALDVPRGTVHKMWNSGSGVTRAKWQVRPALRTEEFFASVDASRAYRRTAKGGTITLLGSGPILRAYSDEFRPPIPQALAKPMFALLAVLARLRGYPAVGEGTEATAPPRSAASVRPASPSHR